MASSPDDSFGCSCSLTPSSPSPSSSSGSSEARNAPGGPSSPSVQRSPPPPALSAMSAHFSAGLGLLRRNQAKRAGSRFLLTRLEKHTTLEGHGGCVNTTKFTNDGNVVITGSDDTNIKLWDWRTGECLLTVETLHTGNIFQATQLLHSSDSIVSCAADGQVQIHSLVHS